MDDTPSSTAGDESTTSDSSPASETKTSEDSTSSGDSTSSEDSTEPTFDSLGLPDHLLRTLDEVGYETPSPIQFRAIPPLLEGRDLLGQAQTGTGKTAAFALPLLARLDSELGPPQVLVLAPTRELAIQVAEAFQRYASKMRGFRVLPIYGGQGYDRQLSQLRRGVHVVVGTPGRVMDHMRRGTLDLGTLKALVLDEADEMLRMGFREDVEWILGHTPPERQIALFSATLPPEIRRIASAHMKDTETIRIERTQATAETVRQRYWLTRGVHKLDALTRLLEVEDFDGMIVFVRTKSATVHLAEKLQARGFSAAPMNGDMPQNQRERTVAKMEKGQLDILVATDVAARGLDLDRVSHVVNFDIPYDIDSYVHRVGRTGRAGRQGEAILFVAPRERRLLAAIEQVTRAEIERMELPSVSDVNDSRVQRFEEKITATLESGDGREFQPLLERYQARHDVPGIEIAAALASMLQGKEPFLLDERQQPPPRPERGFDRGGHDRGGHDRRGSGRQDGRRSEPDRLVRYRVAVGREHGAGPGDLVGAIAGETGLEGRRIGRIDLREDYSFVELPAGMPPEIEDHLKTVRVRGQALEIELLGPVHGSGESRGGDRRDRGGPGGRGPGGRGQDRPGQDRRGGSPRRGGDAPRRQPPGAGPRFGGGMGPRKRKFRSAESQETERDAGAPRSDRDVSGPPGRPEEPGGKGSGDKKTGKRKGKKARWSKERKRAAKKARKKK